MIAAALAAISLFTNVPAHETRVVQSVQRVPAAGSVALRFRVNGQRMFAERSTDTRTWVYGLGVAARIDTASGPIRVRITNASDRPRTFALSAKWSMSES
jgi:hypothetical protein